MTEKNCPGCNCENTFCPDFTDDLKTVIIGLLETGRECADDYERGERGYYYWVERAKGIL